MCTVYVCYVCAVCAVYSFRLFYPSVVAVRLHFRFSIFFSLSFLLCSSLVFFLAKCSGVHYVIKTQQHQLTSTSTINTQYTPTTRIHMNKHARCCLRIYDYLRPRDRQTTLCKHIRFTLILTLTKIHRHNIRLCSKTNRHTLGLDLILCE